MVLIKKNLDTVNIEKELILNFQSILPKCRAENFKIEKAAIKFVTFRLKANSELLRTTYTYGLISITHRKKIKLRTITGR